MNTSDFLDILEQRDLVPQEVTAQLRKKSSQEDSRITPKAILKYLVKKELVTRRQAKQLLETTLTVTPRAESSILGMVPMPKIPSEQKKLSREEDVPTLTPVESEPVPPAPGPVASAPEEAVAENLDSLVSESLAGTEAADAFAEQDGDGGKRVKKRRGRRDKKKNEWDSPLLLLGGGGLAILLIVGVIVTILIGREDAEAVLREASDFFDGGSYTQAIKQYEHFVETFPKHPQFSTAKVKLGMAKLWATQGKSNFAGALETAQEVLDDIEDEKEFKSAQRDLASLLPSISQGLASQAEKATESDKIDELIDLTNKSLSLCTNTKYVPKTFRDEVLLDEVRETLDRVRRAREQRQQLAKALRDIQTAIDAQDTAAAFGIHKKLLEENPGLMNNEALAAKVLEISQAEAAVVKYVAESFPATTSERPSNTVAALALAQRSGTPAAGAEGTVAVRVDGAVFGLNAGDGALLWRKFLGIAPQLPPQKLPNGDFLVVDNRHHDLLKLAGDSGDLIWRLELGAPISLPVVADSDLLISDRTGKLHVVDLSTGERRGYVEFAQKLRVPPVVATLAKRIYVVGDHSSLYTISTEDFSCLGVHYLGHAPGSVSTAPVTVLGKVIVAVNTGAATSQLKVLTTNKQGVVTGQAT
ncbi:MAG: PQQ-binding-like beta-propeller repeat protein, partial [Pirellulales bacterium]|nr:PQQ-binding-like beta-propeller repeat protein [Pirellulales bacterium]